MLWGGLLPIRSRFALDLLSLSGFLYSTLFTIDEHVDKDESILTFMVSNNGLDRSVLVLICASLLPLLSTAGWTDRWPITFPMIPILSFQFLRRYIHSYSSSTSTLTFLSSFVLPGLTISSVGTIILSAILCILFPAVELPPVTGPYNVGVVDLHLPVSGFDGRFENHRERTPTNIHTKHDDDGAKKGYVSVRFFYPTNDHNAKDKTTTTIPYLNPNHADEFCNEAVKLAPPPLNKLTWLLRTWKLISIPVIRNAKPSIPSPSNDDDNNDSSNSSTTPPPSKLPVVVFSHGLTGANPLYTYQTLNLASHGSFVMLVEHTDGTALLVPKHETAHDITNSKFHTHDTTINKLKKLEHVRARRRQADYRTSEFLAAVSSLRTLDEVNIPQLDRLGISFVDMLEVHKKEDGGGMVFMGHSFGAVTALGAASLVSDLVSCVVAHDPAIDWATDYCRSDLFERGRFEGSRLESYEGGFYGYEHDYEINEKEEESSDGDGECIVDNNEEEEKKSESLSDKTNDPPTKTPKSSSLHHVNMFFLYSHQFKKSNWGEHRHVKDMLVRGKLGPKGGLSDVGFVYDTQHSEFSDTCMKTPLWVARASGLTGRRNPVDTAQEIAGRTLDFVNSVRKVKE